MTRVRFGWRFVAGLAAALMAVSACAQVLAPANDAPLQATGTVERWLATPAAPLQPRRVDVWLPPSYAQSPRHRYPVLYMHDGQNLFDPGIAFTGSDWDIDGAMTQLVARGEVREAIVVGVWNTSDRFAEYMPQAAVTTTPVDSGIEGRPLLAADGLRGDDYLRFLVDALKPEIDRRYRTRPGRDDTFVMGSSMGGLISLYAISRHPRTFGAAAALSTHWPACGGCMIDWFAAHLPPRRSHRLYFDFGTATLDARYPPYQARMDTALSRAGWHQGRSWRTLRFEGAKHNEAAWRDRAEVPLRFLLAPPGARASARLQGRHPPLADAAMQHSRR